VAYFAYVPTNAGEAPPPKDKTLPPEANGNPQTIDKAEVRRPADGQITSEYGNRVHPITGKVKHHNGLDFGTDKGTDFYAIKNGIVESVGEFDPANFGENVVKVKWSDGSSSVYGHGSNVLVKYG
jgi:murein DD-endopeptidase MepM/ murein hydrolase activator NlpD